MSVLCETICLYVETFILKDSIIFDSNAYKIAQIISFTLLNNVNQGLKVPLGTKYR